MTKNSISSGDAEIFINGEPLDTAITDGASYLEAAKLINTVQAVNDLRGDIKNAETIEYNDYLWHFAGDYYLASKDGFLDDGLYLDERFLEIICSREEFNQCVKEMSQARWIADKDSWYITLPADI